ncbi:hypothetical protein M0Q50_03395 [bacterium]|jgi:hypothetical protein|nr:hypothetical protein [bacterium]
MKDSNREKCNEMLGFLKDVFEKSGLTNKSGKNPYIILIEKESGIFKCKIRYYDYKWNNEYTLESIDLTIGESTISDDDSVENAYKNFYTYTACEYKRTLEKFQKNYKPILK